MLRKFWVVKMGIPNQYILKQRLNEISNEFREKYGKDIEYAEDHQPKKAATLFEYFVLYNTILTLDPDEIVEMYIRQRSGPTYLPLPGVKYWKTVSKMGIGLRPSFVVRKSKKFISIWFDKPLVYFKKGNEASIRPDIVIRTGNFRTKEDVNSAKFWLLKDNKIIVECGISNDNVQEKGYQVLESTKWEGKKTYIKFKEEFIHPPLIIECKSFGAVLGNIEKYSSYGESIVVVSPEKLYKPKTENIYIIKLDKQLKNFELREKLTSFLSKVDKNVT